MLETLDTLIAFIVVMLGFSLVVTTLIQIVGTVLALRGKNLVWGIQALLEDLHSELPASLCAQVTEKILTNRLISDSMFAEAPWAPPNWKVASAIRFEELLSTLDILSDPRLVPVGTPSSVDEAIAWLNLNIRITRTRFESMMDRVSQRFTMHMRMWTIGLSVLIAFASHLDTIMLLEQFSSDSSLRSEVAAQADTLKRQSEIALAATPDDQNLKARVKQLGEITSTFTAPKMRLLGKGAPIHGFLGDGSVTALVYPFSAMAFKHLSGILLSCILLSFGAPFWFSQLKSLTNLRSVVATREEEGRTAAASAEVTITPIATRDLPPSP